MNSEALPSYHYQIMIPQVEIVAADGSPASPAMLYHALTDQDPAIRVSAGLALARVGEIDEQVVNTLLDVLGGSPDPDDIALAYNGIIEVGSVNPALVEHLLIKLSAGDATSPSIAACLGDLGQATPEVIAGLLTFLQQSQEIDPQATVQAAQSLLQLGHEEDALVDLLLSLYQRGDLRLRHDVVRALGFSRQPHSTVVQLLLTALDYGGLSANYAAEGLMRIGLDDPQVVAAFVQASETKDWRVREKVVKGLGMIQQPTPAVVAALCTALSDREWFVRRQALESLGKLGVATPTVLEHLLTLLTSEEQRVKAYSEQATLHPPAAEYEQDSRTVLKELSDGQSLRGDVAMTLAQLGCVNDAVVTAFLAELNDGDASVRERIVRNWWLLGGGQPHVLAALQSVLQDESQMVRDSAAVSLERYSRLYAVGSKRSERNT